MSASHKIPVPNIGDFSQVEVIEVLVAPGDKVQAEQALITLESDKATMEIPSPMAGVVEELYLKTGAQVGEGDPILSLRAEADSAPPASAETASAPLEAQPPAPPEPAAMREVRVPDIGDFQQVEVIEVLVAPGDRVETEQSLITLESDKATMEIPSPEAGIVHELHLQAGARVAAGDPILSLQSEAQPATASAAATPAAPPTPSAPPPPAAAPPTPSAPPPSAAANAADKPAQRPPPQLPAGAQQVGISRSEKAHASPSVRRFARELGVDLGLVRGSGPKERILKQDIKSFTKAVMSSDRVFGNTGGFALPESPPIDFSKFGEIETRPLSRLKRIAGQHLQRSWITIPHVTQFEEADVTEMEKFRQSNKEEAQKRGIRLTPLSFLLKAVVVALHKYPEFNSSLSPNREEIIIKKYYHIGIAVNTKEGLVVPVIQDVNRKGLFDLAAELQDLGERARARRLRKEEMQGGCFTVSSLGSIGGLGFTPIINTPEVAILGVARSTKKPVYSEQEGNFKPRLMLPFSLSYDHRVIDGVAAGQFANYLRGLLGDIRSILL